MSPPNPLIQKQLREARAELARLKAEKLRRFPPNPHPFIQRDRFPFEATPEEIRLRNELVARIEELEQRIEELEDRLYTR
jgi:ribosomal protein L29